MAVIPTETTDMIYPLLPLRDVVVYPHMVVPLFVGREKSITALEDAMENDKQVVLLAQRNPADDNPELKDLYSVGTLATILQMLKLPDGTLKVLVEGASRVNLETFGCLLGTFGHLLAAIGCQGDPIDAHLGATGGPL